MLATDKQQNYLRTLAQQRPGFADYNSETLATLDTISIGQASDLITQALNHYPKAPQADLFRANGQKNLPQDTVLQGSYWTHQGQVARVRQSKSSGRFYAELLTDENKFEYTKGLVFRLKARMTVDEARAWGSRAGRCCVCAALLTDPNSIDQGIGPICIKKV